MSSKVDDFGTNRNRVCDFLLVGHCDYGPNLHRFRDMATYWLKIAYFSYSSVFGALAPQFHGEVKQEETGVIGLSYNEDPHDRSLSRFDTVPACDGRQTDGRIYYS